MNFKGRTCLYHSSCPGGKIFTERAEYEAALRGGWVDAPWEIDNPEYMPAAMKKLSSEVPVGEEKTEASEPPPDEEAPRRKASPAPSPSSKRRLRQGAN